MKPGDLIIVNNCKGVIVSEPNPTSWMVTYRDTAGIVHVTVVPKTDVTPRE